VTHAQPQARREAQRLRRAEAFGITVADKNSTILNENAYVDIR